MAKLNSKPRCKSHNNITIFLSYKGCAFLKSLNFITITCHNISFHTLIAYIIADKINLLFINKEIAILDEHIRTTTSNLEKKSILT